MDQKAIQRAEEVFSKQVVPVRIDKIAKEVAGLTVSAGRIQTVVTEEIRKKEAGGRTVKGDYNERRVII